MSEDYWIEIPIAGLICCTIGPARESTAHIVRITVNGESRKNLEAMLYNAFLTLRDANEGWTNRRPT